MAFHLTLLGIVSALAVIIPGVMLLILIRGVKAPALRNLTILLVFFGLLHGVYHILLSLRLPILGLLAGPVDLVTVLILIFLGVYYGVRVS